MSGEPRNFQGHRLALTIGTQAQQRVPDERGQVKPEESDISTRQAALTKMSYTESGPDQSRSLTDTRCWLMVNSMTGSSDWIP